MAERCHPRGRLLGALAVALSLAACGREPATGHGTGAPGATPRCDPDNGGLVLPAGFCALVVADHYANLRHLAVRANGDLYASFRNRRLGLGGVVALRDADGDGRAEISSEFDPDGGVGIEFKGDDLYLGTDAAIVRYRMKPGELTPTAAREVIVSGFPRAAGHESKTFAFDGHDGLYVAVGAPSNACQAADRVPGSPGLDPCPQLANSGGVWRVPADRTGQDYLRDGERYTAGLRHTLALAWDDRSGGLYAVQQGRDELARLWPEQYDAGADRRLPGEEFLRLEPGGAASWPYCYFDGQAGQLVNAPEYAGAADRASRCARFPAPLLAFEAHASPADLVFYAGKQFPEHYRGGAFVTLQGRSTLDAAERVPGYVVAFVPFRNGLPSGPAEDFARGFIGADGAATSAAYRPAGLAVAPDGSLYLSDSNQGRIWRIRYEQQPGGR